MISHQRVSRAGTDCMAYLKRSLNPYQCLLTRGGHSHRVYSITCTSTWTSPGSILNAEVHGLACIGCIGGACVGWEYAQPVKGAEVSLSQNYVSELDYGHQCHTWDGHGSLITSPYRLLVPHSYIMHTSNLQGQPYLDYRNSNDPKHILYALTP